MRITPSLPASAPEPPPTGLRAWTYDQFPLPIPARHRYPRGRLTQVRERLLAEGTLPPRAILPAMPADWDTLALVHTPAYLNALREGSLTRAEQLELGIPFSPELLERARAAAGATLSASRHALRTGAAATLGGGNHHAHADRGAGYCVLNDIAVAIRAIRREHPGLRVAIVDLDVHQGDGNATVFARDPDVFTLSAHGAANWPYRKAESDLDIPLPDGTGDSEYCDAVEPAVAGVLERFRPDIVFYQAGVDPLATDRLGRLALTPHGLRRRDEWVLDRCHQAHCRVVVTLGGGYSEPLDASIAAHCETVRILARLWPPAASDAAPP